MRSYTGIDASIMERGHSNALSLGASQLCSPYPIPFLTPTREAVTPPSLPVLDEEEGGDLGDVTSLEWEVI